MAHIKKNLLKRACELVQIFLVFDFQGYFHMSHIQPLAIQYKF